MKRIISLLLVVIALLCAVGCGVVEPVSDVEKVMQCYQSTMPTRVFVETETDYDGTVLLSEAELLLGTYQGKTAAIYKHTYQYFAKIEDFYTSSIISKSESKEYFEGMGLRQNFISNPYATFYLEGENFAPDAVDALVPNLTEELLEDISYENGIFKATVPEENIASVFGEEIELSNDATLEIEVTSGTIVSAVITYSIPELVEGASEGEVTITINYSYDVQPLAPIKNS